MLTSFHDGESLEGVGQIKPVLPPVASRHTVYHSNREKTKTGMLTEAVSDHVVTR